MRTIHLASAESKSCWYVTEQADADAVAAQVLNEIKPNEEQIYADTETCTQEKWRHQWKVKSQIYKPGLDPFKSRVRLLQLGWRDQIWVIDLFRVSDVSKLRSLLESDDIWKWFVNGKFDYKHLAWDQDIILSNMVDMMAGAKLLNMDSANMQALAYHYLGRTLHKEVRITDWSVPDLTDEQLEYAADDIATMMQLRVPLVSDLKKRSLWGAFSTECGALAPAGEMELNGTKLSREAHAIKIAKTVDRREVLREQIIDRLEPFLPQMCLEGMKVGVNLKSPQKLLAVLQKAGLDIEGTSKAELKLKALDHPVTADVLEFKKCDKMISSFGPGLLEFIHPETGRTHPNFHGLFTTTFRFSCSDFNMQQIPRDKECRAWFVPNEGWKIVMADYAAIEMLGAGVAAKDAKLLEIFRRKLRFILAKRRGEKVDKVEEYEADPHYVTAVIITGKIITDILKKERQNAKPANFGFLYGMSWKKFRLYAFLEYGVTFTDKEAQLIRMKFFSGEGYPGLERWHRLTKSQYKDVAVVRTLAGYEIPLEYNSEYDSFAGPAALNYQVQNPCAAGNKKAMAKMWKRNRSYMRKALRWTGPMLVRTIHDENHLECPAHMAEDACRGLEEDMKTGMDAIFRADDLVSVEASAGDSWADKA